MSTLAHIDFPKTEIDFSAELQVNPESRTTWKWATKYSNKVEDQVRIKYLWLSTELVWILLNHHV